MPMSHHLVLRLKAPIASFGVISGEEVRRTGDFPTRSQAWGLIGNAMGLDRGRAEDMARLNRLQSATAFAALLLGTGEVWTDVQNARTPGELEAPSERIARGGRLTDDPDLLAAPASHSKRFKEFMAKPVQRQKQYLTGVHAIVALSPVSDWPENPDDLAAALRRPARPLWIGRKACPSSAPVFFLKNPVEAPDGVSALVTCLDDPLERKPARAQGKLALLWEGRPEPRSSFGGWMVEGGFPTRVFDRRDWVQGIHTGESVLRRGSLHRVEVDVDAA
jgi:CRISPR system Cascade subunit CasD